MNKMQQIKVAKITINIGAGKDSQKLEKGVKLIETITGKVPVKTFTTKRIPSWGLRSGLPIGCKLTLRNKQATKLLARMLEAKDKKLKPRQFDNEGNIAFGIHEYIDIPDADYDPDIGIMGLEVCITLERPGFRVKHRRIRKNQIPRKHRISQNEAVDFIAKEYDVQVGDAA